MEVTPEGDPVDLAIMRTLSFPNRKIVRGSTPTDADTSTICREYDRSDRRAYEIACVQCGKRAEPRWEHIRWERDRPETAAWACPHCGVRVPERHKAQMVDKGGWRAARPEVEGHAGFALNALLSPHANAAWGRLAAEYLAVHDAPDRLRTFKNLVLGEGWAESLDALEPEALAAWAQAFGLNARQDDGTRLPFPAEVLLVTAGADVQDDRIEVALWGHDREGAIWALGHFVIWGSSEEDGVWRELDALIETRWDHPLGGKLGVEATAVDAGDGGIMDRVCAYAWARTRRAVLAVKGMAGRRPIIARAKRSGGGAAARAGPLWIVGVDEVKASLLARLSRAPDTVRFSSSLPLVWFEQLTAERRVVRQVGGRPVRRFERIPGRAAEALDGTVYAIAARQAIGPVDFEERARRLTGEAFTATGCSGSPRGAFNLHGVRS